DEALRGRYNMVTGANEDDWHLTGVDPERDFGEFQWADLRAVSAGEPCINCGAPLDMWRGIEVGHIFKLGTKYSIAFDATVLDEDGRSHPIVMGSYGIGVERNMAAVVEAHHDERGIIWPVRDRKSTRLNSSHGKSSYAVFCLKKKRFKMEGHTRSIQWFREDCCVGEK